MIGLRLDGYDPDLHHDAAVAFVFAPWMMNCLALAISIARDS